MNQSLVENDDSTDMIGNDPIKDLFRKIFQQRQRRLQQLNQVEEETNDNTMIQADMSSYLVLMQHSMRLDLRLQQHSASSSSTQQQQQQTTPSELLYRRAGVLTPWEMASRDWQAGSLWLQHMVEQLSKTCPNESTIVWCSTIPKERRDDHVLQDLANVTMVNESALLLDDPWGWDSSDDSKGSLNSLDNVWNTIYSTSSEETAFAAIVLESLTPLLQRHGFARVVSFLHKLQHQVPSISRYPPPILIIPALTEVLSPPQHVTLEDMAQSVLCLEQGQATWLHQGVRERGNLMRQVLPYDIDTFKSRGSSSAMTRKRLVLLSGDNQNAMITSKAEETEAGSKARNGNTDMETGVADMSLSDVPSTEQPTDGHDHQHSHNHQKQRSGKIQLTVSEEGRQQEETTPPVTAPPAPRIYMQEDDPEFEDYDEEDPDDDLDI